MSNNTNTTPDEALEQTDDLVIVASALSAVAVSLEESNPDKPRAQELADFFFHHASEGHAMVILFPEEEPAIDDRWVNLQLDQWKIITVALMELASDAAREGEAAIAQKIIALTRYVVQTADPEGWQRSMALSEAVQVIQDGGLEDLVMALRKTFDMSTDEGLSEPWPRQESADLVGAEDE